LPPAYGGVCQPGETAAIHPPIDAPPDYGKKIRMKIDTRTATMMP
jgi:hypothetical protein